MMTKTEITIEPTVAGDISGLQKVLQETGLFPPEMLPQMLTGHLEGAEDALWLTCHADGQVAGFCLARPEALTDGTWNMLAIAVLPARQRAGLGGALVRQLEAVLRGCGQRMLVVDTSGTEDFAATRAFYARQGYAEVARIPDFWAHGDDKVIFRKAL